jgi:hypothetical protein
MFLPRELQGLWGGWQLDDVFFFDGISVVPWTKNHSQEQCVSFGEMVSDTEGKNNRQNDTVGEYI